MRYYAFYHTYGINTTDTCGNIIGRLYVFDTRQDAARWDSEDVWDGNYHRSTISSKDARKYLEDMWFDFGLRNKADARYMSMSSLVDRYTDWVREEYM